MQTRLDRIFIINCKLGYSCEVIRKCTVPVSLTDTEPPPVTDTSGRLSVTDIHGTWAGGEFLHLFSYFLQVNKYVLVNFPTLCTKSFYSYLSDKIKLDLPE